MAPVVCFMRWEMPVATSSGKADLCMYIHEEPEEAEEASTERTQVQEWVVRGVAAEHVEELNHVVRSGMDAARLPWRVLPAPSGAGIADLGFLSLRHIRSAKLKETSLQFKMCGGQSHRTWFTRYPVADARRKALRLVKAWHESLEDLEYAETSRKRKIDDVEGKD
jgi:hypothetical protein